MKFKGFASCSGLLSLLIVFGWVPGADAEERYHKWTAGLRGGPSFLTQDAVRDMNVEGQIGPLLNGVIVYDVQKYLSVGFEAEWEQHKLDQAALTLGNANTASLFVRLECRLERSRPVSPYVFLAGGYNINSFRSDDAYEAACGEDCRIDIDNSFAFKAGFGADMFLFFENAAISVEIAWLSNTADIEFISGGEVVAGDDYNGSALSLLLGFRYYFPVSPFD
jgi:hypothetical protein